MEAELLVGWHVFYPHNQHVLRHVFKRHHDADVYGFERTISTTTGQIVMKFNVFPMDEL